MLKSSKIPSVKYVDPICSSINFWPTVFIIITTVIITTTIMSVIHTIIIVVIFNSIFYTVAQICSLISPNGLCSREIFRFALFCFRNLCLLVTRSDIWSPVIWPYKRLVSRHLVEWKFCQYMIGKLGTVNKWSDCISTEVSKALNSDCLITSQVKWLFIWFFKSDKTTVLAFYTTSTNWFVVPRQHFHDPRDKIYHNGIMDASTCGKREAWTSNL